jgi:hypothetical protein
MSWTVLAGSLAAVLALAGLARLLKLGESRIDDPALARAHAEELLVGFEAGRVLLSEDGRAALVAGNGTVAALKRHGAQVAARRLVPPLRMREAVEGVTIETGERLFGSVTLTGVIASDIQALEASLTLV